MLAEYPVIKIIKQLELDNLLPGILFRTSRRQCDADVERLDSARGIDLPEERQHAIYVKLDEIIARYDIDANLIRKHEQHEALVRFGVGAHHAGQLLVWRLVLEELMSSGLMRLLVATGTVAAGVDFPARTVIVTAHSRRGSEGFRTITASELQQMSGRAGRRGRDTLGLCVVAPGPYCDARILADVAKRPPEPLRSAYYAAPATVLNLLKYRSVDDLRFTIERSLAAFLDRRHADKMRLDAKSDTDRIEKDERLSPDAKKKMLKKARRHEREADVLAQRQIQLLEGTLAGLNKLGYTEQGRISEKGVWAANLCTHLILELSECVSDFLFDDLSVEMLVGLVGSVAGDAHRTYLGIKQQPIPKELLGKMEEIVDRVRHAFDAPFNPELQVVPNGAATVLTWMETENWQQFGALLRLGGVAEGDAARLIMQTAEHLSQMCRLYETHPELARVAAEGKRRLLRPPISESLVD